MALIKLSSKLEQVLIYLLGGLGGSGINFARSHSRYLRIIVDSLLSSNDAISTNTINKYFDIISSDPQGVNVTTPSFICFPNAIQ
ncbi:uncharacterized protein Bfra_008451 [Botrytis fragariae]|uniref:Uncharacterized protein n=1 Tax=Botrytis fragariae TaxID=1964551 RepID=A0A8H6ASU7_9HELO|nr:uncharacterized protein Bfra_008451 [Botrytis fragariae]KAF5873173.1 hypothetical protein Bfra_008451 [Botrytis fragariae]